MTKRVWFEANVSVRINETDLGIMQCISERDGSTVLSVSSIASDQDCSVSTVRKSLRALTDKGLIEVRSRYQRNGGQLENEYELTEAGENLLHEPRIERVPA